MKYTLFTLLSFLFVAQLSAQSNQNTVSSNQDSDPEAKAILEKMRNKYEGYSSMEVSFELEIKFPEEPAEVQQITFMKKGEAYRVEMPGRKLISDGTTLWMIQERNKEVQINDVPEVADDPGILSPQSLFSLYERKDFAYFLIGQSTENGKAIQQIEFKPLTDDSDFSKMRLTVVKGSNELVRVKAFGKDGARFTVKAKKITPNKSLASSMFTFNKSDYSDYYVEDLRY